MSGFADMVTAMVVLAAASGEPLPRVGAVTSETVSRYTPEPRTAAAVASRLRSAGFDVGPTVGVAFSLTGEADLFESYFGHAVQINDAGEAFFLIDGRRTQELPAAEVPDDLRPAVQSVVFSPAYDLDR